MARHKDQVWVLPDQVSFESASLAVLMDIRDVLKAMNNRLQCSETMAIPRILREISRNTKKRKYRRKAQP